jgi:hypothetical protein
MPITENSNALLTNYFQFSIARVPNIVYFCQTANLPGIAFGEAEQPTIFSHPIKVPVGSVRFDPLVLNFKVDENLNNWIEIHNWIKTNSNYIQDGAMSPYLDQASDGDLLITNSSYKPKIKISFRRLFPVKLGNIEFSTVVPDATEAVSSVTFSYTDYSIERLETP